MRAQTSRRGFSLVEMLVVVGILVLIAGMFLPAIMRARKHSMQAKCINNLRQIGALYVLYAERNEDYIPLGTSTFPFVPGVRDNYHTHNNQYVWMKGTPSAAMGPFVLAELITFDNSKLLYCPVEAIDDLRWELNANKYRNILTGGGGTITTSYAVRPIERLWNPDVSSLRYPEMMPKLTRNDHFALVAEHPQRLPFSHGTEASPAINVLFGDTSVRTVGKSAFDKPLKKYLNIDSPTAPGFLPPSNHYAINEDDATADTIWRTLDQK